MWRFREALPIGNGEPPVTLGEGGTPLVRAARLERRLGAGIPVFVKDESQNPTGSFKSRGMSAAVTRARRLGARALAAPSAGNAGGALAAYGARAGLPVTVFLPRDTPPGLIEECRTFGAVVELECLGWIGPRRPKMFAVQSEGCAPIVRAFERGEERASQWDGPRTAAWGLRVPSALGDRLMLEAIRASRGAAVAVSERALLEGMSALRAQEGIDASEEGGAALAGLAELLARRTAFEGPVVLFNTGSALTYGPRR